MINPLSIAAARLGGQAGNGTRTSRVGSKIGATIGGATPLGPVGAGIGAIVGGMFGPAASVGPNGQVWFGADPSGYLSMPGASGDNGINPGMMRNYVMPGVNRANQFLRSQNARLQGVPKYFQMRSGENGMDPTIELGSYMAPYSGPNSLIKALVSRGYTTGDRGRLMELLGGPDAPQVFSSGKWMEPKSIHPIWRGGVNEATMTPGGEGLGFLNYGPDGSMFQRAVAVMNGQHNESLLAQYAADPSGFENARGVRSSPGARTQSRLVEDAYGRTYETPTGGTLDPLWRERGWDTMDFANIP